MKWKKCVIGMMCALSVLVSSFLYSGIVAEAEVQQMGPGVYSVGYAQPPTSSTQGYFNVIWSFANGTYNIDTYYWSIVPYYSTTAEDLDISVSRMNINVKKDGIITFTPSIGTNMVGMCTVVGLGDGTNGLTARTMQNLQFTTSTSFTIDYHNATDIYAYACYGNLGTVVDDWGTGESHPTFTVLYGSDTYMVNQINLVHNQLASILSALYSMNLDNNNRLDNLVKRCQEIVTNTFDTVSMLGQVRAAIAEYGYEIDKELEYIYDELTSLHEDLLAMKGEESTEELPSEDVGDYLEKEDELIQDTTDYEDDINFNVDLNSNSVVWSIIERFLNANSKVFGAFVGILSLGIVALILGR